MASVIFYEKPGCATNRRQRRMLEAAGHALAVRDLLTEDWTADRLRRFFTGMPVKAWINPAAPAVKSGRIAPEAIAPDAALAAMLADPLLIRRPLMEIDGVAVAGFDMERLSGLLGLGPAAPDGDDPQACSRRGPQPACPTPARPDEPAP